MTTYPWIKEWPTANLRTKHVDLKHGPNGNGSEGPCPFDCEKCHIEAELAQRQYSNGHIHSDPNQPCPLCFAGAREAAGLDPQTFQFDAIRHHGMVPCANCRKPIYEQVKLQRLTMPDGRKYNLCLACTGTLGGLAVEFDRALQKIHHGDLQMVVLGKPGGAQDQ